jgi:hypothetical protein
MRAGSPTTSPATTISNSVSSDAMPASFPYGRSAWPRLSRETSRAGTWVSPRHRRLRPRRKLPRHHLRVWEADLLAVAGGLFPTFSVSDAWRAYDAECGADRRRLAWIDGDAGRVVRNGRRGGRVLHRRRAPQHGGVRSDVFVSAARAHLHPAEAALPQSSGRIAVRSACPGRC